MNVGTKSLLVGYHQFLLHPLMVARAWWELFGFPWDVRLWVAFFTHDLGYVGKPNMDGIEGQQHPFWGADLMHQLFDDIADDGYEWHHFSLNHSRTLANLYFQPLSKLGYADKLAFLYYPKWLLKILYALSGEGVEYLKNNGYENTEEDWDKWYEVATENNLKTLSKLIYSIPKH